MSEYDQRQYARMLSLLHDCEQERLPLAEVISGLDSLLSVLEDTPESWRERFKSEWWSLEQIYAANLDRNEGILKLAAGDRSSIAEALCSLRALVDEVSSPKTT